MYFLPGISLTVVLSGYDVLKQLPSSHPANQSEMSSLANQRAQSEGGGHLSLRLASPGPPSTLLSHSLSLYLSHPPVPAVTMETKASMANGLNLG